jgi:hypothetical protein
LLIETILQHRFVAPLQPVGLSEAEVDELTGGQFPASAPKITPNDRRIDWNAGPSNADILLRSQVLGRLWDDTTYAKVTGTDAKKRITYTEWTPVRPEGDSKDPALCNRLFPLPEGEERAHTVQIINRDVAAGDVGGPEKIFATYFTIEGGKKDRGGQELIRDIRRIRKNID